MKILGIIPSRYASTRLPAKSLADIGGKSVVMRVYEQALKSSLLDEVIVATDHGQIYDHVIQHGGKACLTRDDHISGTDRCQEALLKQGDVFDYVVNIQGDEPFIHPAQIDLLASLLDGKTEIATLVKKIERTDQLFNPNVVKALVTTSMKALYFSRAPLPYVRNRSEGEWLETHVFYKHIGMYAYRTDILGQLTQLPLSSLEKAESLEQLRWLENGFAIHVALTEKETLGIDTLEDLEKARGYIAGKGM